MFSSESSMLMWFGIFMIPTLIYSVVQIAFYAGLKTNFPRQWKHAGSPTIWSDGSWVTSSHIIKYLKKEKYQESNDELGILYCKSNSRPMIYTYYLSIFSALGFFVVLLLPTVI